MIARFKNSWMLLERSLQVIAEHKKLLVFPLITFAATMGIFLFFLAAFLFQPTGHSITDKSHWEAVGQSVIASESIDEIKQAAQAKDKRHIEPKLNQTGIVIFAAIYFISIFLATFFNVAFYHEIIEALNGRAVGIGQGISFAISKIRMIFIWSLFVGLVGYLISQVEQRVGFIGRIIVRLIGLAWSVAAVFAIPVIICDETATNPIKVVKSSALSLKKKWGETVIGYVGFSGLSLVIFLGSMGALFAGFVLAVILEMPLMIPSVVGAWFFFIFAFAYISSVAGSVYRCALYLFASQESIPAGYTTDMMELAFRRKKQ